jgi:predicted DNA-binding protein
MEETTTTCLSKAVSFRMSKEGKKALIAYSREIGVSSGELIRHALHQFSNGYIPKK